tara:strand:- start:401 stop:736 length:336 start_codon:yes stop_codon:yes gene_type:complete
MNQTFQLSFDIQCGADPSDLLDRLIEFQQHLVDDLEQEDDVFGEPMPNRGNENTCSVGIRPPEGGSDLERQLVAALKQIMAEGTSDRGDFWKARMMLLTAKNAIQELVREE